MNHKILIICLMEKWIGISRLPASLHRVGFSTYVLCTKNSYISKTRFVEQFYFFKAFTFTRSKLIYFYIIYVLLKVRPRLVVPGDEDALLALQNLANIFCHIPFLSHVAKNIRSSIGPSKFDRERTSKNKFLELCQNLNVRVPENFVFKNVEEAKFFSVRLGYPVVLKSSFGYGASGVRICRTEKDLIDGVKELSDISLRDRIITRIKKIFFISPRFEGLSVQRYIKGNVGLVPFCAFSGNLLGVNPMMKHRTFPGETGPSSVCVGFDNEELKEIVRSICSRLEYTGFGSLDFIIEEKSQLPFIIELNPRPVPTTHFAKALCSVDLCEALSFGIQNISLEKNEFRPFIVALYPNEMRRDPQSEFLTSAFHDVPYNDPELYEELGR